MLCSLANLVDDPCDDVVHWLPLPESPKKQKETKDDNS